MSVCLTGNPESHIFLKDDHPFLIMRLFVCICGKKSQDILEAFLSMLYLIPDLCSLRQFYLYLPKRQKL